MARKSDGTVYIDTLVDTKGFGKGMNSMKSQVGGLTGAFKKLGVAIGAAFAIKQLVQFSQKAIDLGSDLQEVENVVGSVFTTMSEQVDEFAKNAAETAEEYGLCRLRNRYAFCHDFNAVADSVSG